MGATFRKAADAGKQDNSVKAEKKEIKKPEINDNKPEEKPAGPQAAEPAPKTEPVILKPDEKPVEMTEPQTERTSGVIDAEPVEAYVDPSDMPETDKAGSNYAETQDNTDKAAKPQHRKALKKKGKGFGRYFRK